MTTVAERPSDTATATNTLASHVASLATDEVPADVRRFAARVLLDTVGVLLGASQSRAVTTAAKAFAGGEQSAEATVIGHGRKVLAERAAFINGTGGHSIELDDSHGPSRTHAAAVLVPAALAAAELRGGVSGRELLNAIIVGYDVESRVSRAMGVQNQFDRGFHPTSVCGTIGASAVASRLLGLDADATSVALGLGASQSSGVLTFEDDPTHLAKSFQTGIATRNGLVAGMLAAAGFEGARDALGGRYNVLVPFGGPDPSYDELTAELGSRFDITLTSIKRHACCGQTHAVIDALLAILDEHELKPDEIERIDTEIAHKAVPIIDNNPLWTHNIQYVVAVTVFERQIWLEHFEDDWTTRPDVAALAKRVTVGGADDIQAAFPAAKGGRVTVTTRDGRQLVEHQPRPVGHPKAPLSDADLARKFRALAEGVIGAERASELLALLDRIDELGDLAQVFSLMAGDAEAAR